MSAVILQRLQAEFDSAVLTTSSFRGDDVAQVESSRWHDVACWLLNNSTDPMDHFVDLTAVDYPLREPDQPRFDLLLLLRTTQSNQRIRLRTQIACDDEVQSLCDLWPGANWAEREVFDMFGIRFRGHPDLRRILMYEEFQGYPLRKDYPIDRVQPLVPYRDVRDIDKLPPFGAEEGQPWGRLDWSERLQGRDRQVSPSIAMHSGERLALSASDMLRKTPGSREGESLPLVAEESERVDEHTAASNLGKARS